MKTLIIGMKGVGKTKRTEDIIAKAIAEGKKVFSYDEAVKYYNKRFGPPVHDEVQSGVFVHNNIIDPPPLIEFRSMTDPPKNLFDNLKCIRWHKK